jgi:hypothetical protein
LSEQIQGGGGPGTAPLIKNAILCRVHAWGNSSLVMTLDANLRKDMGIVIKDVLAFRVMVWKGRRVMIGEKVPLSALANLKDVPPEFMLDKSR